MAGTTVRTDQDAELLQEYELRRRITPWAVYPLTALPAIRPFHESKANIRVLFGPNRGGKTTAGAFEIVSYACGFNPVRNERYETPNVCWAVCLTLKAQGEQMLRAIAQMLPRHENGKPNWRYWKQAGVIKIGAPYFSEIYIKQQEDGREAFYGEGCTAIWIDEGKDGETGLENFNEMLIREIPGQPLKMFLTLTPLNGADWLYRRVWDDRCDEFIPGTFRHRFEAKDTLIANGGWWTKEQIDQRAERYDEDERDARLRGLPIPFGTRQFFKTRRLMAAMDLCGKPRTVTIRHIGLARPVMEEAEDGDCQLFRPRESGHEYIASWDPGTGSGGDNSAFIVLDRTDLAIVFQARNNHMDPDMFANQIALPAARYFNEAQLVVEVNGPGAAALQSVEDYQNLYLQKIWDKQTATMSDKVGWRTTEPNRHRIMDSLARTLREARWSPTQELLEEMSHVVNKKSHTGHIKAEHADGFHDDLVMAVGIALTIHYEEPIYEYPDMRKLAVRYQDQEGSQDVVIARQHGLAAT